MIAVEELTKTFPTPDGDFLAVDRVSFTVSEGEVFGLLGANGAGKTTTLRMILGLLEPSSGDARVDGFSVKAAPDEIKRRIGLVSASAGLYQWLTPRETILFFGDLYGLTPETSLARLEDLTLRFDLKDFLDRRSGTLSTGQKQRVNLARALIHDPPMMLMDEPTRGLDVVGTQVIFDYIARLRDEGKAVVVCTHRLDEASRLCDRFGLLHRGRMRHQGTLEELRSATGEDTLTQIFLAMLAEPHFEINDGGFAR
jgi:ABC-2 type transport system ATP-binding protein/sodium transport system ATP-binding protein